MLRLDLGLAGKAAPRILCLGAHCDDIEIGCGGAILRLLEKAKAEVTWVVLSSNETRANEAREAAAFFLAGAAAKNVVVHGFRDGFLPYAGAEVKDVFERIKREVAPDLIFTHYRADLHQDHRLVSDLTWNTFRNHLILEYEIPKYDGDLGVPNCFIPLDEGQYRKKISGLLASYPSQAGHAWFTEDTFLALMRLRGMESNAPSKHAEAFYCRKLVVA